MWSPTGLCDVWCPVPPSVESTSALQAAARVRRPNGTGEQGSRPGWVESHGDAPGPDGPTQLPAAHAAGRKVQIRTPVLAAMEETSSRGRATPSAAKMRL